MPLLGAHLSMAGGFFKAADAAADLGMDAISLRTLRGLIAKPKVKKKSR